MTRDDWDDPAEAPGQPPPAGIPGERGVPPDPLARLWRWTEPPEPRPERWVETLRRIEAGLPAPRPPRRGRFPRHFWGVSALSGAVAASLLGVLLTRPVGSLPPAAPPRPADGGDQAFPVLSEGEVTIISISSDDSGDTPLVVGRSPLADSGPLALLGPGEVTVDQIERDDAEMDTHYRDDGASPPMIVAERRPNRGMK